MPLSEHEQRMLEQMERALYAEDPKFATALEGSGLRTYTRRRVYQAVAGFLVGIALLMAGDGRAADLDQRGGFSRHARLRSAGGHRLAQGSQAR